MKNDGGGNRLESSIKASASSSLPEHGKHTESAVVAGVDVGVLAADLTAHDGRQRE